MNNIEIRPSDAFPEPEFSLLRREVFVDVQQPSALLVSALEEEDWNMTSPRRVQPPIFRVGAYDGHSLVAWSFGWMERARVFTVANSGVLVSHRRRGIYTSLLLAIQAHAVAEGAVSIRSQHSVMNNAVIIAKLRAGFNISGLSQSADMGTLVELTQHLHAGRQQMFRTRALPYVAPDA
jgi:hypothetical protein